MTDQRKKNRRENDNLLKEIQVIKTCLLGNFEKRKEGLFFVVQSLVKRASVHEALFFIFITALVGLVFVK